MADGGYQGNPEVIMPYRKPRQGQPAFRMERGTEHRPQAGPRPGRARPVSHEVVEHPAQLPGKFSRS